MTLMILHFWRLLTYNPDYQLIGGIITPHQQGVIDDEVAGEEVGVAVYGSSQDGLTVGADVQRVVVDQLQEVLIQQNHLTALLPRVCLDVTVSQGAFEVKHLQRTCHSSWHHRNLQILLTKNAPFWSEWTKRWFWPVELWNTAHMTILTLYKCLLCTPTLTSKHDCSANHCCFD